MLCSFGTLFLLYINHRIAFAFKLLGSYITIVTIEPLLSRYTKFPSWLADVALSFQAKITCFMQSYLPAIVNLNKKYMQHGLNKYTKSQWYITLQRMADTCMCILHAFKNISHKPIDYSTKSALMGLNWVD